MEALDGFINVGADLNSVVSLVENETDLEVTRFGTDAAVARYGDPETGASFDIADPDEGTDISVRDFKGGLLATLYTLIESKTDWEFWAVNDDNVIAERGQLRNRWLADLADS